MKLKMEVYLKGLKSKVNRQILVNDDLSLQDFCEYVILSMNGNCKHLYQLVKNEEYTYLGPSCSILYSDMEEMMEDLTIEDIYLRKGDKLLLNYDFKADWDIVINVKEVKNGYYEKNFQLVSGRGKGIIENIWSSNALKEYLNSTMSASYRALTLTRYEDLNNYYDELDIENINNSIDSYLECVKEKVKPKRYIMNIALSGFDKEIKRKVAADSNLSLEHFCRAVITSMNGDLSHLFGIKIGKEYLEDDVMQTQDLNYLELKEKQRLQVIYDFGDCWTFKITVSKIIEEYGETRKFEVLSGKGYGIVDDCGGICGLEDIFNKVDTTWGEYDINDFDIKKINANIDIYM